MKPFTYLLLLLVLFFSCSSDPEVVIEYPVKYNNVEEWSMDNDDVHKFSSSDGSFTSVDVTDSFIESLRLEMDAGLAYGFLGLSLPESIELISESEAIISVAAFGQDSLVNYSSIDNALFIDVLGTYYLSEDGSEIYPCYVATYCCSNPSCSNGCPFDYYPCLSNGSPVNELISLSNVDLNFEYYIMYPKFLFRRQ